jgi:ABC-type glycerol-3-phosphate transport system substrate-binding protein
MCLLAGSTRLAFIHAEPLPDTSETTVSSSYFRNQNYYRVLTNWQQTSSRVSLDEVRIPLVDQIAANPDTVFETDTDDYGTQVAVLPKGSSVEYQVSVSETGLYEIGLDFIVVSDFYTVPLVSFEVNGAPLFNEASSMELGVTWKVVPLAEEDRYNRYGNELLPSAISVREWNKYYFDDYNNQTSGNYVFLLEAGSNTLRFTAINLAIKLGDLYLKGTEEVADYAAYRSQTQGLESYSDGEIITIQGESFIEKSDLEIKSSYYKESAMTPYAYRHSVLNQLDGSSMSRGGSEVKYQFSVAKTGYYQLAFKNLQSSNPGIAVGKRIMIDGELLFSEMDEVLFPTAKKWNVLTIGEEEDYWFYLTEGEHTLSFASTLSHLTPMINQLYTIMDQINDIGLRVQTITGGNPDDALDWNLLKYLPNLTEDLLLFADQCEAIYETINALDTGMSSSPQTSTLLVASKQLRRLARTPNKLGSRLMEFSEGSGSSYQLIGNAIGAMMNQPLSIDAFYFYNDVALPRPTGSFFVRLWHGIKAFFYSFFDTRYNQRDVGENTLEVWVGQSSLYLDIIQSMIDREFTRDTGIEVKCSILSDASKIILSNATQDNPDVVLSLDTWVPYAYALRGMLEDLSTYPDFQEVASHYVANHFTTLIHGDGVYGIPETQSMYLLYYRLDILNYLNLSVPDTWEDVINMLPMLQSHRMNFFHPLGGDAAFKGYGTTTPLIYQFGGEIYTEDGIQTTLKEPITVEAIRFMTDLFTIHNLPLQVSSFFEHFRSGSIPIGISTVDLFLQLKYAAPELSGQWGVSVIPGIKDNQDQVNRDAPAYGKASILFANSNLKAEGWELIKWWNQTETQIKFMQNIKTNLGEKFLVVSANMDALEASVWEEEIKQPMLAQAIHARTPAVTPGSYIVERELSNIWNKVVIDLMNPSVAINESIPRITRELNRKFEEFGYKSSTNPNGKDYIVPLDRNITRWIWGDDDA